MGRSGRDEIREKMGTRFLALVNCGGLKTSTLSKTGITWPDLISIGSCWLLC